jgi:hypothetical protein
MDAEKIDEDYLGQLVATEVADAESWMQSSLAAEQESNLDYYFGDKFGNEKRGFSQVVTRDVLETVEGIMPELMKLFTSGDQVVEFDSIGPFDEAQVEIEGRYINHLFMNRAPGYKILYDWFKDALLMKNGVIKVGWESKEQVQFRDYEALTEEEYDILEAGESSEEIYLGANYEIDSSESYEIDGQTLYDCRVKITRHRGYPVVENIPSEDFRIKERSVSIASSPFVAQVTQSTVGELVEQGYDEDDLGGATGWGNEGSTTYSDTGVPNSRFQQPDESSIGTDSVNGTGYDRLVDVIEAYVETYDVEDGKVKLFRVIQVGHKVLEYEETDRKPFISLSPIMMPHKYSGIAVADLVRDIQEIRSTIMRQILDNLALSNSGRYTAVEGMVNLQDAIDNKIGGIVRQKMAGAFQRLDTPDLSNATIPVLDMLELQKEGRTGVSRMTAGLDQSALSSHQTAAAVNQVMTAAQGKILLIARNFAETGVKELFIELYNQIREHQTTPDMVPINGRYAIVNPEEWIERTDVHVTVGIGNGNKDQQLFHLGQISQLMQQIASSRYGYLITEDNVFNLASEFVKNSGYVNPTQFISNPATVEPPPPPPNPELILAEAKAKEVEGSNMSKQAQAQIDQGELLLDQEKFLWEKKVNAAEVAMESEQKRPVGVGTGK